MCLQENELSRMDETCRLVDQADVPSYGGTRSGAAKPDTRERTYIDLLRENRSFGLFLASYIANKMGDWLTYVASISAIEQIQRSNGRQGTSGTIISALVVIRIAPNVLLSPFGGVIADGCDRRKTMIGLDLLGSLVALLYVLAVEYGSVSLILAVAFLQECVSGVYEPSRSAIIPQLVSGGEDLKNATTLAGLAWSVMTAVGSSAGGLLVALLGVRGCFVFDCFTFLTSALLMSLVGGEWSVASNTRKLSESLLAQARGMFVDGVVYLWASSFGAVIFLKAWGALIWGATDVLHVAFAERGSVEGTSIRLGIMFGSMGIGSLMGPQIIGQFTSMRDLKTIEFACISSIAISTISICLMGLFPQFWVKCLFTGLRASGSSSLWINSSLLLQEFSSAEMLGRATSLELALALLSEAVTATVAGFLLDHSSLSADQVCFLLAGIGTCTLLCWSIFKGGTCHDDRQAEDDEECSLSTVESSVP